MSYGPLLRKDDGYIGGRMLMMEFSRKEETEKDKKEVHGCDERGQYSG